MSWNFVWFQTDADSSSFLSWNTKKFHSPPKTPKPQNPVSHRLLTDEEVYEMIEKV